MSNEIKSNEIILHVHGGNIHSAAARLGRPVIDFSANINPLGIPPEVEAAMHEAIKSCVHYPDPHCTKLAKAVAEKEGLDSRFLFFGNGAAEVIFTLAYATRPKKALVLAPTFSEYVQALTAVGCEIIFYRLDEKEDFTLNESVLSQIDGSLDMVLICNPNNPTGLLAKRDLLLQILNRCEQRGIRLVMDECFNEFLDDAQEHTLLPVVPEYQNLFILKSLTKIYALAGVRLGYGVTRDTGLIRKMAACMQPWSVSSIAQAAGEAAMRQDRFTEETLKAIRGERCYLKQELINLGYKVFDSKANFIFFRTSDFIQQPLEDQGFLIRSCANYRGLDGTYYRIAVKSHQDNRALVEALKKIQNG